MHRERGPSGGAALLLLLLVGHALLLGGSPRPAAAQDDVEALLSELSAMLPGGGAGFDPAALVARELPAVEKAAGLRAKGPITARLIDREAALAHLTAVFAEQLPAARLRPMEAAWRALGLLGPNQSLKDAVLGLYGSQVGGFYDPATRSLALLDDVPALLQVPVARHELVHALQDQHHGLAGWLKGAELDEDVAAAMQAVLEGHASDVMNRVSLESMGLAAGVGGLDTGMREELREALGLEEGEALPDLAAGVDLGLDAELLAAFIPRDTPAALRAQLLFPYVVGTRFISEYRAAHPGDAACAQLYRRPPRSTAEVLNPALWSSGTFTPDYREPGKNVPDVRVTYSSALGRLLSFVTLTGLDDPFAGAPEAARWSGGDHDKSAAVGAGWRGDRVVVMEPVSGASGMGLPDAAVVVWMSRWATAAEAVEVGSYLAKRVPDAMIERIDDRVLAALAGPEAARRAALLGIRAWR